MSEVLNYEVIDRVATITLNRPKRKNAFTLEMVDLWSQALREAAGDGRVGSVVVTGAGDAFCSGVDLEELARVGNQPLQRKRMLTNRIHRVALALDELDKPVLAAMRGAAVGAGLDMALLCDMRFAGRSVRLSEGYITVGLVPGDGGAWLLPRLVGTSKALELLLSGDVVEADEALRIGLVNRVYADDDVFDRTMDFAARLAVHAPVQMAMIKRAVRQSERIDLRTHFDLISSHFAVASSLDDHEEALAALRGKRMPRYRGR